MTWKGKKKLGKTNQKNKKEKRKKEMSENSALWRRMQHYLGLMEKNSAEPVAEPVAEPDSEPVAEPVAETVSEPVSEPATEAEQMTAQVSRMYVDLTALRNQARSLGVNPDPTPEERLATRLRHLAEEHKRVVLVIKRSGHEVKRSTRGRPVGWASKKASGAVTKKTSKASSKMEFSRPGKHWKQPLSASRRVPSRK